jgi:CubicO group peptidase (beta-lactamase class C family)
MRRPLIESQTQAMIAAAVLGLFSFQSSSFPPPSDIAREVVSPGISERIDGYLERLSGFGWSGAVLLIKDKKVVISKAYGMADRVRGYPMRVESLFDIGSLGKQFTATAILRLEREGKLSVQDSLGKFLLDAPPAYKGITLHQLMRHRAGIPGVFGEFETGTKEEALRRIFARPPRFKPDERFQYSNAGYTLLAAVVEAVTKERYQDYIRRTLFHATGMSSTGWFGKELPKVPRDLVSLGYDEVKVRLNMATADGNSWAGIGAGEVASSIPDLYRWFLALQGEAILDRSQKDRMWTPGEVLPPSESYFGANYGYGWQIQTLTNGKKRIYHGGDGYGHGSGFSWYPDDDMLMISATNIRHDWFPTTIRADRIPPLIALGKKFVDVPAFSATPHSAERILGKYRLPTGGVIAVWKDDYGLQVGADGQDACDLLDPAPKDRAQVRRVLDRKSVEGFRRFLAGNMEAMADLGVGPDFGKLVYDEIKGFEKRWGKFQDLRSLGMYTGGFMDFTQVLEFRYERGRLLEKIHWEPNHLGATWQECPRYASPIRLQPITADRWIAWSIITRKSAYLERTKDGLRVEGPEQVVECKKLGSSA